MESSAPFCASGNNSVPKGSEDRYPAAVNRRVRYYKGARSYMLGGVVCGLFMLFCVASSVDTPVVAVEAFSLLLANNITLIGPVHIGGVAQTTRACRGAQSRGSLIKIAHACGSVNSYYFAGQNDLMSPVMTCGTRYTFVAASDSYGTYSSSELEVCDPFASDVRKIYFSCKIQSPILCPLKNTCYDVITITSGRPSGGSSVFLYSGNPNAPQCSHGEFYLFADSNIDGTVACPNSDNCWNCFQNKPVDSDPQSPTCGQFI